MGPKAFGPKAFVVYALSSSEGTAQGTYAGAEEPNDREVHQRRLL